MALTGKQISGGTQGNVKKDIQILNPGPSAVLSLPPVCAGKHSPCVLYPNFWLCSNLEEFLDRLRQLTES